MKFINFIFSLIVMSLCFGKFGFAMQEYAHQQAPVLLIAHAASGLQHPVYDAIVLHAGPTNAQKNAVINAVRNAIAAQHNQNARDAAIDQAVLNNGNHPGWAQLIRAQVDISHPLNAQDDMPVG